MSMPNDAAPDLRSELELIEDLTIAVSHFLYSIAIRPIISTKENDAIVKRLDAILDRVKVLKEAPHE